MCNQTHDRKEPSLFKTDCCVEALTSTFVVAFITLTLMRQPLIPTTLASVGRRVVPQVLTSGGVLDDAVVTRVRMNLKALAVVQDPVVEG